jgi:hypothetical protein
MESIEFLAEAFYFLLKVCGGILGIVFVSYLGVLIYDEFTSRSNELYELSLAVAVGAEYLLRGKPKKPQYEYTGRHRLDAPFISDLVIELRENPNSLCYNKTVAIDSEDQLCGVF